VSGTSFTDDRKRVLAPGGEQKHSSSRKEGKGNEPVPKVKRKKHVPGETFDEQNTIHNVGAKSGRVGGGGSGGGGCVGRWVGGGGVGGGGGGVGWGDSWPLWPNGSKKRWKNRAKLGQPPGVGGNVKSGIWEKK